MSSHPRDLTSDIIDAIRDNEKMSRAIHLPVQSGNDRILKLMNRHYTKEKYLSLVEEIKQKIPSATLSTDIIVGFPTESNEEFLDTCDLIQKVKFNGVFAFMYSIRKGTPAEKMGDQIPQEVKKQRINKLLALEKQIQTEIRQNLIGTTERVLITEVDTESGFVIGKTDCGRELFITNTLDSTLRFEKTKIYKVENNSFYAELV